MADEEQATSGNAEPESKPQLPIPNFVDSQAPPPEAVEAMRKIAEQRPGASLGISMAMGAPVNPIHGKVTESHITQVLQTNSESVKNDFELKKERMKIDWWKSISDRIFEIIILAAFISTVVFVIKTFEDKPEILRPTLTGIGGLFAGFLAGIGYGKRGSGDKGE